MTDFVMLHRAALETMTGYVVEVGGTDLARPTPCAGWTVGDLLAHMIGQHRGFAAAVRDGDAPAGSYVPVPFALAEWHEAAGELLAVLASADPERCSRQVELAETPLPNRVLLSALVVDTVVHTWDLAHGLGGDHHPPAELTDAVLAVVLGIPDRAKGPGGPFAEAVPPGAADDAWAQALRLVGRDPDRAGEAQPRVAL